MHGRTYVWSGGWSSSPKRIMRGMGLRPSDVQRVASARVKKTAPRNARTLPNKSKPTARRSATSKSAPATGTPKAKPKTKTRAKDGAKTNG